LSAEFEWGKANRLRRTPLDVDKIGQKSMILENILTTLGEFVGSVGGGDCF
jgi:hypothetical protein